METNKNITTCTAFSERSSLITKWLFCGWILLSVLSSCSIANSPEDAKEVFENFVKETQEGNPQKAIRAYCRGKVKETFQSMLQLEKFSGEKMPFFPNYKGVKKVELLPEYKNVALVVADLGYGGVATYILHFDESGEWKIYYGESQDLTEAKDFITGEVLENIGILTISNSEINDLLEF